MFKRLRARLGLAESAGAMSSNWARQSFAQEGEDLIIDRLQSAGTSGYYVDVGAHHPLRFSNTYLLYRKGWSGICIDPLPGAKEEFETWRPRDVFVEEGVSESGGELTYSCFNEPALNTFDPVTAAERDGVKGYAIIEVRKVRTRPLSAILDEFSSGRGIDVMSVDVEGLDLEVLRSNDWSRYLPKVLVAECYCEDFSQLPVHPIVEFLRERGYVPFAKTGHSVVFSRA